LITQYIAISVFVSSTFWYYSWVHSKNCWFWA